MKISETETVAPIFLTQTTTSTTITIETRKTVTELKDSRKVYTQSVRHFG